MKYTNCKGANLLNTCIQKNSPKNIKVDYNQLSYNIKKLENSQRLKDKGDNLNYLKKIKSYNTLNLLWECTITFENEGKECKYTGLGNKKVEALSQVMEKINIHLFLE